MKTYNEHDRFCADCLCSDCRHFNAYGRGCREGCSSCGGDSHLTSCPMFDVEDFCPLPDEEVEE